MNYAPLLALRRRMKRRSLRPAWLCRTYVGSDYGRCRPRILVVGRYAAGWDFARSGAFVDLVRWRKRRSTFWSFVESATGKILGTPDPLPAVAWTNVMKIAGWRGCGGMILALQKEAALEALVADFKALKPDVILLPTGDFQGGIVNKALALAYGAAPDSWEEASPGLWHATLKGRHVFITRVPQGWKKKYADLAKAVVAEITSDRRP